MSWRVHVIWQEPAPEGTYAPGTLVDRVLWLGGFVTREDAWEAGRRASRAPGRIGATFAVDIGEAPASSPPPLTPERARAWIGHAAVLQQIARERVDHAGGHDHRRGAAWCPVCAHPGDFTRCGIPDCGICGPAAKAVAS